MKNTIIKLAYLLFIPYTVDFYGNNDTIKETKFWRDVNGNTDNAHLRDY